MATGIEQLGALAGPVNQGDVVMRQSEAPAGAAAMLNKMARKNTPGVYKLPDTKPATPEFMQSAMANVQRDLTSMARNVESVGPEGHMLAYITPEEAGILKLLGGSGNVNPATGVPQFDRGSYLSRTAGGTQQPSAPVTVGFGQGQVDPGLAAAVQQQAGVSPQEAKKQAQQQFTGSFTPDTQTQTGQTAETIQERINKFREDEDEQNALEQLASLITFGEPIKELPKEKLKKAEKLINEYEPFKMPLGSLSSMLGQMFAPFGLDKDDPKRLKREDGEDTLEGLQRKLKKIDPNIMESLKKYDPKLYYKFNVPATTQGIEDLSKVDLGKLKGGPEDRRLAARVMEAREYMSKKQEGRPEEMGAAPAPFVEPETPAEQDPRAGAFAIGDMMPYTSDRTGGVEMEVPLGRRFQLGREGEMAPKGMDLQEAMKYATMGGYQQLEPFQEYIARRREYLGEEEPEYFDEEGNVIFSGVN